MYELYLKTLHPENPRLFQRIKRTAETFDIHDFERTVLYENAAQGMHSIKNMLPSLTEMTDRPRLTNHSIRTTAAQTLLKLGFPEHLVKNFMGK